MLEISLILANREPVYQDMASKFFAHYVAIIDAINNMSELGKLGVTDIEVTLIFFGHGCLVDCSIGDLILVIQSFLPLSIFQREKFSVTSKYERI